MNTVSFTYKADAYQNEATKADAYQNEASSQEGLKAFRIYFLKGLF